MQYIVKGKIFTDPKAAVAYSHLMGVHDAFNGGPGFPAHITKVEASAPSYEKIMAELSDLIKHWSPSFRKQKLDKVQKAVSKYTDLL